ncbi:MULTISPECIES: hypothetical protein [unclassified Nocardia]|nr:MULTISPECIES: hypothetical protein [unclassified Nocardia]
MAQSLPDGELMQPQQAAPDIGFGVSGSENGDAGFRTRLIPV